MQSFMTNCGLWPDVVEKKMNMWKKGTNRGIFRVQSGKKSEIEGLVKSLESQNPNPDPTENLEKVSNITLWGITVECEGKVLG